MLPTVLNQRTNQLTPYPLGSLRELWYISFPLIVSLMSTSLMLFLDRLFLAHYSLESLHASAYAGAMVQFLQFWAIATACIAEVFVGRANGAGRYEKLGQPVWQMIWLAIISIAIYWPLALLAGPYLFYATANQALEISYFQILTMCIPLATGAAALAAFYIGRGKVVLVTAIMLISNVLNALLDYILIFGFEPWISPLGIQGAALATALALSVQVLVLFLFFFRKTNRQTYGTGRWQFNKRLFTSCLRIGLPSAVAHGLEILVWILIFDLMQRLGSDHMTIVTVSQSILFLFTFITEGLSKGATTVASNLMGAGKYDLVWKLLRSGVKFYLFAFALLYLILVWRPEILTTWFVSDLSPSIRDKICVACFWIWFYFLFDGINWLLIGLLTAAGDTRFIMKISGLGPLLFILLPIYGLIFIGGAPAQLTWMMVALYALFSATIYFYRFRGEKWHEHRLTFSRMATQNKA